MATMVQPESNSAGSKPCPMCNDSGKVDDAYCTCGAGKRLQSSDAQLLAESN